ncbi:MAG TPA: hypothetical protein VJ743_21185 [Albitalea sp.]|nr:hypothetical protein [Albitalea sp.]
MTAEAPLFHTLDRLRSLRLFGLLLISLIGGQWLLIALFLLIPCEACRASSPLEHMHTLADLLYGVAIGPLLESIILYAAIKLLSRLTRRISIHCLVFGVFFGGLHAVTDGSVRWLITGFAFALYTAAYFIYQRRYRWPLIPMTALHAVNNLVAASPLLIALMRHDGSQ